MSEEKSAPMKQNSHPESSRVAVLMVVGEDGIEPPTSSL
jgi:hypothetical protein